MEPITITSSPSSNPSTGELVLRPLLAPVVVSITMGRPDSAAATVVRPPDQRYTGLSRWSRVRAKNHAPGRVAPNRRTNRCPAFASAYAVLTRAAYAFGMCRNIRTLHNFAPPASEEEVHDAALQYVRKISGTTKPSRANQEAFDRTVEAVTAATTQLLADLVTAAPPKNRDIEAAKRRARYEANPRVAAAR